MISIYFAVADADDHWYQYDQPSFVASFGRILRFKDELRRLAATVLYSMSNRYHLHLDVTKSGIQKGTFFGAQYVWFKDFHADTRGLSTVQVVMSRGKG